MSMLIHKGKGLLVVLALVALSACTSTYAPQSAVYDHHRITSQLPKDSQMMAFLQPYSDSVHKSMSKVIAVAERELEKKLPEGPLNNLLADAMREEATAVYGGIIDAAFVNYGGVRSLQLPAGPVTVGSVFELMPFDNLLIVQEIKGSVFQEFLNKIAERGGWPCSGLQFVIKDKRATEVLVGGKPLDPAAVYRVANSDYIANGGDDCTMLVPIPQLNKGVLVRDAFLQYFEKITAQGKKINAQLENRIRYAQ